MNSYPAYEIGNALFQIISLIIAAICLTKGAVALLKAKQFYTWRQQQYATATIPRLVWVVPMLTVGLAIAAWYATLFYYQPWGWVVTAFTTLIAALGLINLSRWSTHRQKVGTVIKTQPAKRVAVDVVILLMGVGFIGLALFVY